VSATDTDTCRSSRVPLIRPPAGVNLIALLNRFPHDLLQATGVATDETLWRLLNRKLNVLGRGGCPHRVCRLSHPIAQVDGFQLKQKDVDYFDAISEQQENGGTEAMLHELLDRDISEFNPMEFPDTPALNEQKQLLLLPQRHGCETCCWTPRPTVDQSYLDAMQHIGAAGRLPFEQVRADALSPPTRRRPVPRARGQAPIPLRRLEECARGVRPGPRHQDQVE
jgi:hypothetical protein